MTKQRFLVIIISLLVLTNIAVLVFFMSSGPKGPGHPRLEHNPPQETIINKLGFNKDQQNKYEAIIAIHRFEIEEQEHKLHDLKADLYATLIQDSSTEKERVLGQMAEVQHKIEEIHYNHFLSIKEICNENQLDSFNELTLDLVKLFTPKPMGPKGPKPH